MNFFWKIICLLFYYLGDFSLKLNDFPCYQFFMDKSFLINEKYNLNIWKEVNKPLDKG